MSRNWQQAGEAGTAWAVALFARLARSLGRPITRCLLVPVWLYFLMVRRDQRRASRAFLKRALGRPVRYRDVARHFWYFAQVVLDRLYFIGGKERGFEMQIEGLDVLHEALDQNKGCLLLGSHLGSFEASRVIQARRPEYPLRILLNRQQTPVVAGILEALDPGLSRQVIDASGDAASIAFALADALRQRCLVGLLADRAGEAEKAVEATFMGDPVRLPLAPFLLATTADAPSVLVFGLYEGGNRYRVIFRPIATPPAPSRKERQAHFEKVAQHYATELESLARSYPYNWFNFYDYWHVES